MLVVIYTDRGIITHRGHLSTDRGINTADYDRMAYITSTDRGIITQRGHLSTDRGINRPWMTVWLLYYINKKWEISLR